MALSPQEYTQMKAFRDLIKATHDRLAQAGSQGTLAQAAGDCATQWSDVDADFANVLRELGNSVWQMSFAQVRPTVGALTAHLGAQLAEVEAQLNS